MSAWWQPFRLCFEDNFFCMAAMSTPGHFVSFGFCSCRYLCHLYRLPPQGCTCLGRWVTCVRAVSRSEARRTQYTVLVVRWTYITDIPMYIHVDVAAECLLLLTLPRFVLHSCERCVADSLSVIDPLSPGRLTNMRADEYTNGYFSASRIQARSSQS